MGMDNHRSLDLWEKYGEFLMMVMPYADNLISEARGCVIKDVDGNEIIDLAAGQFCAILGHNHPKLIEKIVAQMNSVLHTGTQFLSPIVLEAAARFAEVAPGELKKSLLLSTGTEANECALTIAKIYTRKTGVVGFSRGYYGLSLMTKSLSSVFGRVERYGSAPRVPESYTLSAPHCFRCPVRSHYPGCNFLCLETSIEMNLADRDDIAAVIVEPIFSAGGMIVPPPGYLQALKAFTEEREALLIVDEAQTGFGRTGKWFAIQHHGVEPDILVVSKGAGGGFPVSGVITTDRIANRVASEGFVHLASHQSDPVAAAALTALIDIIREEGLVQRAEDTGRYFMERLRELQGRHSIIIDVRGQGLMLGMQIANDAGAGQSDYELMQLIVALCKRSGLHLTYTYFEPVLRFLPPLTISRAEIDKAIAVLDDSIVTALRKDVSNGDLLPANRYSRSFAQELGGKRTFRKILSRVYETSPKFWLQKLNGLAGR
jgi:2,2-dialkylglycine decarboxylase (pyruvate)